MKPSKKRIILTILVFCLLAVLGPTLPNYYIRVLTEIAILTLFVQSLSIILSYGGMTSFGHAAFYGFGAYVVAILLRDTSISLIPAIFIGAGLTAVFGMIVGAVCLRAASLYFAILTLAISQLLFVLVFQWYSFTNGDNGIHGLTVSSWLADSTNYYYFVLVVVGLSLLAIRVILNSPFGYTLRSIRDNAARTVFLGADVWLHRLLAFTIASLFGGLAGGLYVGYDHMVYPLLFHWSKSAEPLLMVILGGVNSFLGPLVGAVLFVFMEMILVKITTYWLFILGLTILILVMFFPKGIMGFVEDRLLPLMGRVKDDGKQ